MTAFPLMRNWTNVAITCCLILGTFALYGRTVHFGFINLDDPGYVIDNREVRAGLNSDTIYWAFTTGAESNWHPLTWISLMLDVSLFGVKPGAMHLVNVGLHAANAALLFVVLLKMTSVRWPSAWVAAMFAWHPLHVESVAWVTERKDTLSTLFLMLCLLAYVRYARGPTGRRLALVASLLILGLLAKSMLVTLPFVMLLLDIWPLKRLQSLKDLRALTIEKWPLFLIVALSCFATYRAQSAGHAVVTVPNLPIGERVLNAIHSYGTYLGKTFVPRGLAVFYPMPAMYPGGHLDVAWIAIGAIVFVLVSTLVIIFRKNHPWLLIGWLWYLGTLVPVIGLVQVGAQSHADRYTYVPLIGIFIALAFEAAFWLRKWSVAMALAAVTIIGCGVMTWRQIGYWHNSETLMRHAAMVVPDNYAAHACLGEALDARGDIAGAIDEYGRSLAIKPNDADALNNLALLMLKLGDSNEAMRLYQRAILADPRYGPAYNNFGNLLMNRGRIDEAIKVYRAGIKRNQEVPQLDHNLALALAQQGKIDEAIALWQRALELDPEYLDAQAGLGTAWIMTGQTRQGIEQLKTVLKAQPDRVDVLKTLAWTLATHPRSIYQNATEAEKLARRAVELTHAEDPVALDTLAAAEARGEKFDDATRDAERALAIAHKQNHALAEQIRHRVELYQSHQPFTSGQ